MASSGALGIKVLKSVFTNLGKVKPILDASLKPSGHSLYDGVPRTAHTL